MLSKLRPTSRWTSKVSYDSLKKSDRFGDDSFKLAVPKSMRNKMLKNYHEDSLSGHMGANKTLAKLQERYWWPKMFYDVNDYVRTCERCA